MSRQDRAEGSANPHPLPFREKLLVGVGGMPIMFGSYAVKAMAMPVYQMLLGVNPAWLGLTLAVPRLWDAFIDPWVGHVSDNTRSRFGRRRPFILIGSVAAALCYGLIWMVPAHWTEREKLGWLLATSLGFYTCYAVYAVPYQSLTFELTPDYDERTSVQAHSSFWYKVGSLGFDWIFPLSQLAIFASPLAGVRAVNWAAASVMLAAFGILPACFGRERIPRRAAVRSQDPFWPALRTALANRALLALIALLILRLGASMVASSMDFYLLVYYMHQGNIAVGAYWKGILTSAYALVGFASIPVLTGLCRRFGKRETLIAMNGVAMVSGIGKWLIFRPGIGWWLLLDPLLSGPMLATLGQVVPSMVADICDEDELRHGLRREGMFGAVFLWIQKTGIALAFFGTGLVLNFSGFSSHLGGAQSPRTFLCMRLFFAGTTFVTSLAAIFFARLYPITRASALETRRQLEIRRSAW